jgi:uncharacterized protein
LERKKEMRYLIDIGHPAHVHYYRNFATSVISKGHEVLFTCRDKDVTISLLKFYEFRFVNLGKPFKGIAGKMFGIVYFTFRILIIAIRFRPGMFINATLYSAFVAWLVRKPHLSIEDTFNMEQVKLYLPFTSCVLTGNYSHPELGYKEIKYDGYHELLYLHPNNFQPDTSVLSNLNLKADEAYVILRFVSWDASHDLGHKGISLNNKIAAVERFSHYAKVFISSEGTLPEALEKYRITIPPHRMHQAMAFCSLIFGESATMVSEGAMLGVPGIFLDNTGRYYTKDQQTSYQLVFNYSESEEDQIRAIEKGVEILTNPGAKDLWQIRRRRMLADKIDVTAFLEWFISHWPESFQIIKQDPDSQNVFRKPLT